MRILKTYFLAEKNVRREWPLGRILATVFIAIEHDVLVHFFFLKFCLLWLNISDWYFSFNYCLWNCIVPSKRFGNLKPWLAPTVRPIWWPRDIAKKIIILMIFGNFSFIFAAYCLNSSRYNLIFLITAMVTQTLGNEIGFCWTNVIRRMNLFLGILVGERFPHKSDI